LSVIGDNISQDRVVYPFASLPESFDMLVTAFEANSDVPNLETVIKSSDIKKGNRLNGRL
uniref:Uncharacterized protein n=1 Tax=Amphimedon queenslandica TaxID=400682 RepID=A0A1X7U5P7_AMPQE